MNISAQEIKNKLVSRGLRVTPQRLACLRAIYALNNHPTAEQIIENIRIDYSNVATGTIYKILDLLVKHQLICKVKTENDVMRYDSMTELHHHLYCTEKERIEDYKDPDLDELLSDHFKRKGIPGFDIGEIRLHIYGRYLSNKNN